MPTDQTSRPQITGSISGLKSPLYWWRPFSSLTRYPASKGMTSMMDLVTNISIVADWDPRIESPAEVFIYTKITPQPAAKVSLLHLQSLVAKATLLRVTPLLPDGSSPRGSPGIRALGIPVVAGRNRTVPRAPVAQRRLSESTLDGVGSVCSSDFAAEDILGKGDEEGGKPIDTLQAEIGGSLVSGFSPANLGRASKETGIFSDGVTLGTFSDGEDIFCTPSRKFDFSYFRQRPRRPIGESPVSNVGISYSRDVNGSFKSVGVTSWQKIRHRFGGVWGLNGSRNCERKSRVCSINSVARDLSPMSKRTLERIVELSAPIIDMNVGGQNGTTEDSKAVLHSSKVSSRNAAAAKECSSEGFGNSIPIEGEIGEQEIVSEEFECSETNMVIEQDTLFICFPKKIRNDAIVIEIVLEVNPLYLEGKSYVTFILAGLPYCTNGAYIEFRVDDEDDWRFHTYPEVTTIDNEDSAENSLCGILNLTNKSHTIPTNRSVIIRALRCPMVLEVLDFRLKTDIIATFSWSPTNERITSEFEINLTFLNLEPDEDAKRSAIDLFLLNGPDKQEDLTVESPQGIPTDFVLGDREFANHEIGTRRCRVLRVERLTKDSHQPLRIRINKQLRPVAQEIGVSMVCVSGEAVLVEESITIMKARLPLEVVFSPGSTSWEEMSKRPRGEVCKKFIRTGVDMREANPSILITCLHPAMSPTLDEIDRALVNNCSGLIDRINYDIEEFEGFHGRVPMVAVKMSFSIDVPIGNEHMEEIVRIHVGGFGFKLATINDELPGRGMLFEDGDELLFLNCGVFEGGRDGGGQKGKLLISTEWFSEQLVPSCGEIVELRLPRVVAKIVGRTIFECTNQQAHIISRTQQINGNDATFSLTRGKVIISGMDTNKNEISLQIPCENEPSKHESLCIKPATTSLKSSQSGTSSFHSIFDEGLEAVQDQRRGQSETTAQDRDEVSSNISTYHWIWEMKETLFLVLIIGFLCFNLVSQSARNSALKASLRQTTAILEEKILNQKIVDERTSLDDSPSHLILQKHRGLGRGSEDMWWSVVSLGDIQEIGHVKIDVLTLDNLKMDSQVYDTTKAPASDELDDHNTNKGQHPNKEQHGKKVSDGPEDCTRQSGEGEHQKKVAHLLLGESITEKYQRGVINVFRFFWSLVFGV